jgi:hypothetical protein
MLSGKTALVTGATSGKMYGSGRFCSLACPSTNAAEAALFRATPMEIRQG